MLAVICALFLTFIPSAAPDAYEARAGSAQALNTAALQDGNQLPWAILPDSLTVIGEEAFEGTALSQALLPATLETIENAAFANIPSLQYVNIPKATENIGETAFANTGDLVLSVEEGSYAEQWAIAHEYAYVLEGQLPFGQSASIGRKLKQGLRLIPLFILSALMLMLQGLNKRKPSYRRIGEGKTMRPQERAELHAIAYRFP